MVQFFRHLLALWAVLAFAVGSALAQTCHAPGINPGGAVAGVVNSYYLPSGNLSANATTIALGTLRAGGGPAVATAGAAAMAALPGKATARATRARWAARPSRKPVRR